MATTKLRLAVYGKASKAQAGITSIPFHINTGLLKITKENVDLFMNKIRVKPTG